MAEYKGVPPEEQMAVAEDSHDVATDTEVASTDRQETLVADKPHLEAEASVPFRQASHSRISFPGQRGNLYYAVLAANLGAMALGPHYSWPSPTLPNLEAADSWLPLTSEQGSWVVSLEIFGTMLGPFVGGGLVNNVGRRWSILIGVLFSFVSWGILLVSTAPWHLYVARFIGGLGGGIEFLSCPMYTAEISEPAVRGALGSIFAFFLVGGYQIGYIVGPYVSYTMLILVSLIPTVLCFLLFPLVPESPYYCLRKGQWSKAKESLTWLRSGRTAAEVQMELDEIEREVSKSMEEPAKVSDLFATRGTRMALLISLGVVIAQPLTGIDVILSYAEQMFIMAGITSLSKVFAIVIGLMLFVSVGFSSPLAKIFGMKNMLVTSGFGAGTFQVLLGLYFYFLESGQDISKFSWVPVFCLVCYTFFFSVGFGPLAWAVVAEVFAPRVKPLASAISTFVNKFFAFLLTKFFIQAAAAFGTSYVIFFFAASCFCASLFVLFLLPDTRGLTLPQILDRLEGKKPEKRLSHSDLLF